MTRRQIVASLAAAAALAAVYALTPEGAGQNALYQAIGAGSVLVMATAVLRLKPARATVWWLLVTSQALASTGDALLGYGYPDGAPFPSLADAAYLGRVPLVAAAFVLLVRARRRGRDLPGLMDSAVLAVGFGLLAWVLVLAPSITDASMSLGARLVATAYPATDVLFVALLARLAFAPGARTASYRFLAGGLATALAGDCGYALFTLTGGTGSTPAVLDLLWLSAYACFAAAAAHPSMRLLSAPIAEHTPRFRGSRVALLISAAMIPPMLLLAQALGKRPIEAVPVALASIALFSLVLARVALLLRETEDLAQQLGKLASVDGLTGVPNRRTWDEELQRLAAASTADGTTLCVAILDLDRFKAFNDTHGHQFGDELLRGAAQAWQRALPPDGVLARFGGEEFTVALPGRTAAEAREVVEGLKQLTPYDQTFSCGVAQWDNSEEPAALVARADAALYEAKRQGRNRVLVARRPEVQEPVAQLPVQREPDDQTSAAVAS